MIFYLTYNDAPSGIYSGQVIDVIRFFQQQLNANISLLAFISLRGFATNKKKIKQELPNAIVLPMFPGVQRWRVNVFLLKLYCWFFRPEKIIGRSVLATQLALKCRSKNIKVVYDGRGAIAAEWKEYNVVTNKKLQNEVSLLEQEAILNSDFRIAVSNALVKYWHDAYKYEGNKHVIIPCTLNKVFESQEISSTSIQEARNKLGINKDDLVFVYSGSIAGWQSFDILYTFIQPILKNSSKTKLLFLSDKDKNILKLESEFKGQIVCKRVSPNEVPNHLIAGDYGLLIRENSITNQVASPVKFAEYLSCGLKVIISENLGDYSNFVIENECGIIQNSATQLETDSIAIKQYRRLLALKEFTKKSFRSQFETLNKF